jgi:hypothetical protein
MLQIKERLAALGLTLVWLRERLAARGVRVNAAQLSGYVHGRRRTVTGFEILTACDDILHELERR